MVGQSDGKPLLLGQKYSSYPNAEDVLGKINHPEILTDLLKNSGIASSQAMRSAILKRFNQIFLAKFEETGEEGLSAWQPVFGQFNADMALSLSQVVLKSEFLLKLKKPESVLIAAKYFNNVLPVLARLYARLKELSPVVPENNTCHETIKLWGKLLSSQGFKWVTKRANTRSEAAPEKPAKKDHWKERAQDICEKINTLFDEMERDGAEKGDPDLLKTLVPKIEAKLQEIACQLKLKSIDKLLSDDVLESDLKKIDRYSQDNVGLLATSLVDILMTYGNISSILGQNANQSGDRLEANEYYAKSNSAYRAAYVIERDYSKKEESIASELNDNWYSTFLMKRETTVVHHWLFPYFSSIVRDEKGDVAAMTRKVNEDSGSQDEFLQAVKESVSGLVKSGKLYRAILLAYSLKRDLTNGFFVSEASIIEALNESGGLFEIKSIINGMAANNESAAPENIGIWNLLVLLDRAGFAKLSQPIREHLESAPVLWGAVPWIKLIERESEFGKRNLIYINAIKEDPENAILYIERASLFLKDWRRSGSRGREHEESREINFEEAKKILSEGLRQAKSAALGERVQMLSLLSEAYFIEFFKNLSSNKTVFGVIENAMGLSEKAVELFEENPEKIAEELPNYAIHMVKAYTNLMLYYNWVREGNISENDFNQRLRGHSFKNQLIAGFRDKGRAQRYYSKAVNLAAGNVDLLLQMAVDLCEQRFNDYGILALDCALKIPCEHSQDIEKAKILIGKKQYSTAVSLIVSILEGKK